MPANQTDVRRDNLSLVLRALRRGGPSTRAKIATATGLTKVAVSSLVADLVERGLVRVGELELTGHTGRPGLAYAVDDQVFGIGVEINAEYVSAVALDLTGAVQADRRVALDVKAADPEDVLDTVAELVRRVLRTPRLRGRRPAGVAVAAHGVVEHTTGTVVFAPNLGWHDVGVLTGLANRLGKSRPHLEVHNDLKLAAMAEWTAGVAAGTAELAYISGERGVGAGMVVAGRVVPGARGFAGEIGHLPLNPDPLRCACGRLGCWETMVGLGALLRLAADPDDAVHDPSRDIDERLARIRTRAEAGDPRTLDALDAVAVNLAVGAAVLINLVNPEVLVLGGYFATLGDFLLDTVRREVAARAVAPDAGGCRVVLSTLGFTAAGHGGAHAVLERVIADPMLVPVPTARGER